MLKQSPLTLSVLPLLVFQNRPSSGCKICSNKFEQQIKKKQEQDQPVKQREFQFQSDHKSIPGNPFDAVEMLQL